MMKNYWLVKSEPEEYGFEHLEADGKGRWDGVRNYQARNFMRRMMPGDTVLVYHSGKHREIAGLAQVVSAPYPDPTAEEGKDWVAVDLKAIKKLPSPVSLNSLKESGEFEEFLLLKQSRLSVMPVPEELFYKIEEMAGLK